MGRTRFLLTLDTFLFLALILLLAPGFSGLGVHEWLGLAITPVIVVHILYGWRWIAATFVRLGAKQAWRPRFNFLLNILLFIAFTVVAFSGVMTSLIALPALGIAAGNFEGWRTLHNDSFGYVLVLAALHVALNWGWITNAVRRHVLTRPEV